MLLQCSHEGGEFITAPTRAEQAWRWATSNSIVAPINPQALEPNMHHIFPFGCHLGFDCSSQSIRQRHNTRRTRPLKAPPRAPPAAGWGRVAGARRCGGPSDYATG